MARALGSLPLLAQALARAELSYTKVRALTRVATPETEAATARLLDLIREFDARGGWNSGFRSCAAWLSWRVGLESPE